MKLKLAMSGYVGLWVLGVSLLTGCGEPSVVYDVNNPDVIEVKVPGYFVYLQEVTLKDGTRCVSLIGGSGKAALQCDWEGVHHE